MATAVLTQDICENCSRLGKLETSITGKQKLCKKCMVDQFEYYKQQRLEYCNDMEKVAEFYKQKIENMSPTLKNNLQLISQTADQIEESYSSAISLLNRQKQELMTALNDCKKDNSKYFDIKNELNTILSNVEAFKDPTQNLFEDNVVRSLVNKFEQSFQLTQNIEKSYASLFNQPIRQVERYERGLPLKPSKKYLGYLYTTDSATCSSRPHVSLTSTTTTTTPVMSTAPSSGGGGNTLPANASAPNLPKSLAQSSRMMAQTGSIIAGADPVKEAELALKQAALADREHNYEKWMKKAVETPHLAVKFDKEPVFMASYRDLLFVVNEKSELVMINVSPLNELQIRQKFNIPLPNIRSIAVNANYFAVTYSDLDKRAQKRNNNCKPHGVTLYERTSDYVDFNFERKFELDTGEFVYPVGIALDADFAYVCDKGLKAVIKMDLIKGNTVARVDFPKGQPYKIAINKNLVVVTDPIQHLLNVYDIRNLRFLRNLSVEQPKAKNGPFSVVITDDDTIFFKNYPDSQLTIVDANLNKHCVFTQITSSIEGFTVIEALNNHKVLVVGSILKNNDYRLIVYFIN